MEAIEKGAFGSRLTKVTTSTFLLVTGYWRLLDFDFLTQVLSHILQLAEEEDWLYTGVPVKSCCDVLEELYLR